MLDEVRARASAADGETVASRPPQGLDGAFWTGTPESLCAHLACGRDGLTSAEAARRLARHGPNSDRPARIDGALRSVLRRMAEPFALILLAAGSVSILTGDWAGGAIIIAILTLSIGLDTLQEGHAVRAAEALRGSVALKAEVRRDGAFPPGRSGPRCWRGPGRPVRPRIPHHSRAHDIAPPSARVAVRASGVGRRPPDARWDALAGHVRKASAAQPRAGRSPDRSRAAARAIGSSSFAGTT